MIDSCLWVWVCWLMFSCLGFCHCFGMMLFIFCGVFDFLGD